MRQTPAIDLRTQICRVMRIPAVCPWFHFIFVTATRATRMRTERRSMARDLMRGEGEIYLTKTIMRKATCHKKG